jgi:hypothetical protein
MLRFKKIYLLAGMICFVACGSQSPFEQAVRQAVDNQMAVYPQSTLKDLYKNFFQDRYGPGHLIPDTTAAGNYLRYELASYEEVSGAYYEPTGWEGCYYRVNLSVIKENLVPYDVYLDAFVRSVNQIVPLSVAQWKAEWLAIDAVIQTMNLSLPDYEKDRQEIIELLEQGEYVMHHSPQFEQHYDPHYRIIEKNIFEKEIKPYLDLKI